MEPLKKSKQNIKTCHKFAQQGGFKKAAHAVRNCLEYGPKSFDV